MWLLILQFILNFPALIKTIIEIWKLIKQIKDPEQKVAYEAKLKTVLKRCNHKKQTVATDHSELADILNELKSKQL